MTNLSLRTATMDDVPALNTLIALSARGLSVGFYSPEQIEAAIRYVFGVDTKLIGDGTYVVAEVEATTIGCGGWSRRRTLYGGHQRPVGEAELLDPTTEAARILAACVQAAGGAGFSRFELMATLPGVPLYEAEGFRRVEDVVDVVPDGTAIPFVRMVRASPFNVAR